MEDDSNKNVMLACLCGKQQREKGAFLYTECAFEQCTQLVCYHFKNELISEP